MEKSFIINKLEQIIKDVQKVYADIEELKNLLTGEASEVTSKPTPKKSEKPIVIESGVPTLRQIPDVMTQTLANYRIEIVGHATEAGTDSLKDNLALFIGQYYRFLESNYKNFLGQIHNGEQIALEVSNADEVELEAWEKFFIILSESGILTSWHYDSEQSTFVGTKPKEIDVLGFFCHDWFPRYVARLLYSGIRGEKNRQMTYLYYPELKLGDGQIIQVDLVLIVDSEFHWCMCVTDYEQTDFDAINSIAHLLATRPEQSHVFIAGLDPETAAQLSYELDLSIANEEKVLTSFHIKSLPVITIPAIEDTTAYPGNLRAFLNKHNLRPFPKRREVILKQLIKMIESLPTPLPLSNYKRIIHQHLGISKTCIQDILNALIRSGYVLDLEGKPLYSFNHPVGSLLSSTVDELQNACRQSYAYVLLKHHPHFFDIERNRREFFDEVGLEPPGNEEINRVLVLINSGVSYEPEMSNDINGSDEEC